MKRLLNRARFHLRELGLLGSVGVALLLGSLVYALSVAPQRRVESDELRHDIARLRQDRLTLISAAAQGAAPQSPELPSSSMTPEILMTLQDMAHQDGLQLKRNEYRYVDAVSATDAKADASPAKTVSDKGRLLEVSIVAPVSGSYQNVRAFLAHVLDKVPTLALDNLSLKRESIAGSDLQAQLRFTLFVRDGA